MAVTPDLATPISQFAIWPKKRGMALRSSNRSCTNYLTRTWPEPHLANKHEHKVKAKAEFIITPDLK